MFAIAALFGLATTAIAADPATARLPNLVVILADDLGYGDLGTYGNSWFNTPNIDRLARDGVRLTDFYADCPVCSPTRAALLTGRLPQRNGVTNVIQAGDHDTHLAAEERLVSQLLQQAGYRTGLFGKWHLGEGEQYRPYRRGFDEFFGGLLGGMDFFRHDFVDGRHELWRNDVPVRKDGIYLTDLVAAEAERFIEDSRERPFFLYVPFHAVHGSMGSTAKATMQAPERWLAHYRAKSAQAKPDETRSIEYAACLSALDEGVGRVLAALERHGLAENTFVFFTSDNGPEPSKGGTACPLRGTKHTLWEGGIRVPAIARWPGHLPAGVLRQSPGVTRDLFPTLLELAGIQRPTDRACDGRNLWPMLAVNLPGEPRDLVWSYVRDSLNTREKALRRGQWKWLNGELYDLAADIGESRNLAGEKPALAAELATAWQAWVAQFPAEVQRWNDRPPDRGRFTKPAAN